MTFVVEFCVELVELFLVEKTTLLRIKVRTDIRELGSSFVPYSQERRLVLGIVRALVTIKTKRNTKSFALFFDNSDCPVRDGAVLALQKRKSSIVGRQKVSDGL